MVDEGKFREDLWYRLNVVRLTVPPLCERSGDIPLLVHYFLKRYNERYQLDTRLADSGLKAMEEYSWPGNVRQLQNEIQRAVLMSDEAMIDVGDLSIGQPSPMEESEENGGTSLTLLEGMERQTIVQMLKETNGNKLETAKRLGIGRQTLYNKINRYDLKRPESLVR